MVDDNLYSKFLLRFSPSPPNMVNTVKTKNGLVIALPIQNWIVMDSIGHYCTVWSESIKNEQRYFLYDPDRSKTNHTQNYVTRSWIPEEKKKLCRSGRAGNSLIGFLSESLVFCPKMSE